MPEKDIREGAFTIIGEMGMTGSIILLNQSQWRALTQARLEEPFYSAILWGGNPLKVVDDATLLVKRGACVRGHRQLIWPFSWLCAGDEWQGSRSDVPPDYIAGLTDQERSLLGAWTGGGPRPE